MPAWPARSCSTWRDQEAGRRAPGRLPRRATRFPQAAAVLARAALPRHGDRAPGRHRWNWRWPNSGRTTRSSRSRSTAARRTHAAAALVNGTKMADPAFRRQLVDGGEAAVAASTDPMIVLARRLDPLRRELTKWSEDNVSSVDAARRRAARQSALRGLRQDHVSRRHLHAAAFLRPGAGLPDERHQGAVQDHLLRPLRPRRELRFRSRRSTCPPRYAEGRDKLDFRRRSIS